jgi:hypothetical protein
MLRDAIKTKESNFLSYKKYSPNCPTNKEIPTKKHILPTIVLAQFCCTSYGLLVMRLCLI